MSKGYDGQYYTEADECIEDDYWDNERIVLRKEKTHETNNRV